MNFNGWGSSLFFMAQCNLGSPTKSSSGRCEELLTLNSGKKVNFPPIQSCGKVEPAAAIRDWVVVAITGEL